MKPKHNPTELQSTRSIQNPLIADGQVHRRTVLKTAAKAGSLLAATGAVSGLVGCESAKKSTHSLGKPIPSDPVVRSTKPRPVIATPTTRPVIQQDVELTSIPSFVQPRSQWTSEVPKRWLADPMKRVHRITIHHDAIMPVPSGSLSDSKRRLNAIRNGHLSNGWADIGYHFAIDPSGRIWQARPLELQGAHVKHHNAGNLGIVVFGNYEKMRPSAQALESLDTMIAYAMNRFRVPLNQVHTHRELRSTACPGRYLQEQMQLTRSTGGRLAMKMSNWSASS